MVIGGTHRNDLKNHALNRMKSLYTIVVCFTKYFKSLLK